MSDCNGFTRAFQTYALNYRQRSTGQCSPAQCFKRTLQTQVMCKCEFVALGGEGVGVAMEVGLQYHPVAQGIILQWGVDGLEVLPYFKGMHKLGDIREDGRVFYGRNKNCVGGEYWMTMDQFLRTCGQDYYERTAAHREYLVEMKRTKDARALKKREDRLKRYHETKHLTAEKRKASREKSHAKMLLDPIRLEKYKAKTSRSNNRYQEKQKLINAEKKSKRKAEQEKLRKIKQDQAEARRVEKERVYAERALAKFMRPKRVELTEEQRKENKRQGKRNYKHVRRARINDCEVKATPKVVEEAKKNAGDHCYYCGKKGNLTLDHFDPLSKGGAHCVSNFVFCCFSCNSRKRDLDPFEFMASNPAIDFSLIA